VAYKQEPYLYLSEMFALGKPGGGGRACNEISANLVYPASKAIYPKVVLFRALGQDRSLGGLQGSHLLEIVCWCKPARGHSAHFAFQGGAIAILTAAERPGHFSGMVLISPLVIASPESATTFKVKGHSYLYCSCRFLGHGLSIYSWPGSVDQRPFLSYVHY
jgi:hypothetical protein